jgi:molybdopterin synthase catalytic subunit
LSGEGARVNAERADWRIRVQSQDFDPGMELEALRRPDCGAVASFVGVARDSSDGFPVEEITLEHYPGMTERALRDIVEQAARRWLLGPVGVVHRIGALRPGDRIVWVGVASRHRDAAFDACRFIVDFLKTRAPFWKRESGPRGARWVQARESDEQALGRWSERPPA